MDATGAIVLGLALLVAGVAGWWLRTRSGAVRTTGEGMTGDSPEVEVLRSLGVRPEDADLTVVQFATAFCAPCRATTARLAQLGTRHPGLAAVHVDAESELDAVRALDVRRTPTLFYLDRSGALLGRSSGAPRPDELRALVAAHAPAAGPV
ncbi:thioredoxin family protein [Klenkia sp. LSe6-5]|uniref:Thioredoxin family protein n=1 Tax=Klenkia sesuvii TaxID=3103137 RepID=A0ABU8DN88_9ACTN